VRCKRGASRTSVFNSRIHSGKSCTCQTCSSCYCAEGATNSLHRFLRNERFNCPSLLSSVSRQRVSKHRRRTYISRGDCRGLVTTPWMTRRATKYIFCRLVLSSTSACLPSLRVDVTNTTISRLVKRLLLMPPSAFPASLRPSHGCFSFRLRYG